MQAGAAMVRAGGAGVFIDNSALAHGGKALAGNDRRRRPRRPELRLRRHHPGPTEVRTMGMHVLGLRDVVMKRADADADDRAIIEVIRYLAAAKSRWTTAM